MGKRAKTAELGQRRRWRRLRRKAERGRSGGEEKEGLAKRVVRELGEGLKKRGPMEGFEERRSGGAKTEQIGHNDFHSSENSIVEQKHTSPEKPESGVLGKAN